MDAHERMNVGVEGLNEEDAILRTGAGSGPLYTGCSQPEANRFLNETEASVAVRNVGEDLNDLVARYIGLRSRILALGGEIGAEHECDLVWAQMLAISSAMKNASAQSYPHVGAKLEIALDLLDEHGDPLPSLLLRSALEDIRGFCATDFSPCSLRE